MTDKELLKDLLEAVEDYAIVLVEAMVGRRQGEQSQELLDALALARKVSRGRVVAAIEACVNANAGGGR